jgi:hypothetical protein
MSYAVPAPRIRRRSRFSNLPIIVGSLLVVTFLGLGLVSLVSDRGASRHQHQVDAVLDYEKAVTGPARLGGFVVEQGMKPSVQRLGSGQPDTATFQAVGWVDQLEQVRHEFAAVHAPKELAAFASGMDQALAMYEDAARTIGAAAISSGDVRTNLLDEAVTKARAADERYDRAAAVLQARRRQLGLGPTGAFPDQQGQGQG